MDPILFVCVVVFFCVIIALGDDDFRGLSL
jgi:hypothetical protein